MILAMTLLSSIMAPAENFLCQREIYQLFAKQRRENLPGEKLCEQRIIEV